MPKWTSGNYDVDKIIQMTQSDEDADEWEIWRWIDYSKLKNIEYLAEGGFGSIWKAEWIDMPEEVFEFYKSNQIALKKLKNSQEISSEFLKELTANFQCRDKYVLPILGLTQDSMTKEYAIVLRYMKNGNLRDFLDQNKSLPWIERLWLLSSFISGLKVIHSKGFVHSDLHPGNLMITEAYNNSKYKFIRLGDLGLCKLANETSSSGTYGILPYIAPEALDKCQYSQASDIYSVGILMWIISTGKIPFANRAYDVELVFDIVNGLRPKINNNIPQCYVELMKLCWHKDPAERPNAEMICIQSENWINNLLYHDETEVSLMFLNANQKMQDEDEDLSSAETTHSEAYITSKPLPTIPEYDTILSRQQFFSIPDNIIEYLAEGGFGSIWKAEWIDMPEEVFEFYKSNQIALKKLKNSQEISSEFLKELTANFQCRDKYVLPILGLTQDSMTKEYAIVLRYMKNGNLRDFLDQNKSLPWIERLWLLSSFISGLKVIHSKGFVHSDLHPGNLMITEAYNNSKYKFIRLGDLGLCKLANETSSSGTYGILPYIAPEALDKCQYSQASDIYSVGILMWIISTGKIPFANRAYDVELVFDIVNGLRPKINNNIPQCYVELMKLCWHKDPAERPNAEMICIQSENWINNLLYHDETEVSLMFLNANQKMQDEDEDLSSAETTHSEAYITSKPLPTIPEYDTILSRQQFFSIPDNIIVEDEESETQEMDCKFNLLGIN
ncbi:hypothetical protein Glove_383g22 [Diversispora epigaea]|uniref:Protein kinase domain-containing protein n=1 Tax=Diversispora epigaea TaxID=1348612 RepID=A0A397H435_9GLOM|nr:hypothetical protein Glove_383g22 [Diversispora epigaea]